MDFATNSIQVVSLTPEQAAEYSTHNYNRNRPLRQHHVDFLTNEMRNGRFMPTAEVHVMYVNGEPALVNGQHTCAAIVKYGKPVRVTLRKTIASEHGQVAMTYAIGHDNGLSRTFSDSVRAYNVAEATSLTSTQVNALVAAIRFIRNGFIVKGNGSLKSSIDLIDDVYLWAQEVRILFTSTANVDDKVTRILYKRAVLSIAILTLHYQTEKAIEFWKGIVDPDRLPSKDVRMLARKILIDSTYSNSDRRDVDRLSRKLARCWNAFFTDEKLFQVKVLDSSSKLVLLGTPYNGKQPSDFLSSKPETMRLAA